MKKIILALVISAYVWVAYVIFSPDGKKFNRFNADARNYLKKYQCASKCGKPDSARIYYELYDFSYEMQQMYREKIPLMNSFIFHTSDKETFKCDCE